MSFKSSIIDNLKRILNNNNVVSEIVSVDKSSLITGSKITGKTMIAADVIVKKSSIDGNITIADSSILNEVNLSGTITINKRARLYKCDITGNVTIGKNTSLWGPNLDLTSNSEGTIKIGNFCSIARNVSFQTYNHNFKKVTSYFIGQNIFKEKWDNEKTTKGDIILENDVWIGTHCVVLGGVTIQNGAVVAANSVVTANVPAYSIVAGSPAKVIGYRFEPSVIEKLEKLAWWDWSLEKIKKNKSFFENELSDDLFLNEIHE
ncbi:MAG: hypothetical protein KA215_02270 [Flavobacterium sp.]|jgi:virginiamycin A acetyltransferase|nr:hypothetical protein [Flavobacterium sp.]